MNTPQELQVWYVLPGIRKELTLGLKREGLKQKEIAAILGITEAAVSQYVKDKRGDGIVFADVIKKEVAASAKLISLEQSNARTEIQRLLGLTKKTKFMCTVCHTHATTPSNCDICYL